MIRENFPLAMQGLVVVPLFGGFDQRRGEGRIFHYDATGGRWEEDDYQSTGSGEPAGEELAEEALAARTSTRDEARPRGGRGAARRRPRTTSATGGPTRTAGSSRSCSR